MHYARLRIAQAAESGWYALEYSAKEDPPQWRRLPELNWFPTLTDARRFARDWAYERSWPGQTVVIVYESAPIPPPRATPRQLRMQWLDDAPTEQTTARTSGPTTKGSNNDENHNDGKSRSQE